MRPDRSKVSSEELLTNLSVVLLKLCEPFIDDEKKAALVDPGFVCSTTEGHGGLYDLTGENTLPRLGENVTNSGMVYNPKNSFIPICFFFCSRSLALSVVPGGSRYENIVRNVYHIHRTIRQQNGDPRTDPRFDRILQLQYCKEIVMMSPTYIADVSRFYNVAAGILLNMDKEKLKTMPEHIVDDMCSVLVYASSFAGQLLAGSDFGNTFRLMVTLLSKDYAHVSANNSCHLFCSARNSLTLVSCRLQISSSSGTTICVPNWAMYFMIFSCLEVPPATVTFRIQ